MRNIKSWGGSTDRREGNFHFQRVISSPVLVTCNHALYYVVEPDTILNCEKIFTMLIFDVSHMTEKIWRCSIFEADHAISFKNMITR